MDIAGIHEQTDLRNRVGVFRDRDHAGILLGKMLAPHPLENGIAVGIPAGGVPVGLAEAVFCANIRKGGRFAVAEAYQYWGDISEDQVMNMLKQVGHR